MARQIKLRVDDERCHVCSRCLASLACKTRAIQKVDPDEPPYLEPNLCRDCRVCVPACPFGAVIDKK